MHVAQQTYTLTPSLSSTHTHTTFTFIFISTQAHTHTVTLLPVVVSYSRCERGSRRLLDFAACVSVHVCVCVWSVFVFGVCVTIPIVPDKFSGRDLPIAACSTYSCMFSL